MEVSLFFINFATPNSKVMSIKGSVTTADYLPYDDYQRLVQTLINEKQYWWACYCVLSFCTGLRYSDVSKLRWSDVLDQRKIIITAKKTNKTHVIPIGPSASEHIEALYNQLGKPKKSEYILTGQKGDGKSVSIQYINRTLKQWVFKYNLNIENFSTHTFRKTFGRYVYDKSGRTSESLMYLNRIFKHTNLDTTMIYLGLRNDEIGNIFNNLKI